MHPRTSEAPLPRSVSSSNSCIEVLAPSAMIGRGNNLKEKRTVVKGFNFYILLK